MTYDNNNNHSQAVTAVIVGSAKLCGLLRAGFAGLLLFTFPAVASAAETGNWRLSVRPSICVSYDSEQPCTMAMQVSWEGDTLADVCLRDAVDEPALHCWNNALRGSVEVSYSNTEDVRYLLVEQVSDALLAEAEIKVINRDLRTSRKRRRHVWSIL